MRAHTCPGITRRLCGGLGASVAQDLRALTEALAEQPAVARSAVELHRCCSRGSVEMRRANATHAVLAPWSRHAVLAG